MKIRLLLRGLALLGALRVLAADLALTVREPSGVARADWPVTSGVPFPAGAVRDPRTLALRDDAGRTVPLQADVLARWPDGSARWVLLDFQTRLAAGQTRTFTLGAARREGTSGSLRVSQSGSRTVVDTGPLRLEWDAQRFDPFGAVWLDRNRDGNFAADERVTAAGGGWFVRDAAGRWFESAQAPAEIVIEETGPLRVAVRVSGRHADASGAMFSYVCRLHAFAGQSFVRCAYTFINDHQESVMASIKELGLVARLASEAGEATSAAVGAHEGAGRIFQVDESQYELNGAAAGERAAGWARVAGPRAGFAIGVREFWQQWPKSIAARDGTVTVGLCPEFPGGLYDGKPLADENRLYYALRRGEHTFKVGVAKTHEVTAQFFAASSVPAAQDEFFRAASDPLLATVAPQHVDATRVAGPLPPSAPEKFFGYDRWVDRAFADHLKRREQGREYGMLNYGDWFGERQVNWGNLEYDLQRGLFLHYLRTGERKFFERAAQAARHHIDVDVVHAVNPHLKNPFGLPPKVGEIWLHSLNHRRVFLERAAAGRAHLSDGPQLELRPRMGLGRSRLLLPDG